jgi:hypothetical protein
VSIRSMGKDGKFLLGNVSTVENPVCCVRKSWDRRESAGLIGICLSVLGGMAGVARAESAGNTPSIVDVARAIHYLLVQFGPQPWTHTFQAICTTESGDPPRAQSYPCQKTTTSLMVLSAGDIRIAKSQPITFEEAATVELPTLLHSATSALQNCSTHTKNTHTEALEVAFSRTASAAITSTVVNAGSIRFNFRWTASEGISIAGSAYITDSNTVIETDSDAPNLAVTRRAKARIIMPAQSAVALEVDTWPVTYAAKFHTWVTVDADLSPNDKKYQHLSDVLAEDQRTFLIAGKINAVDAAKAKTSSRDLPFNAALCPASWPEGGDPVAVPILLGPLNSTVVDTQWAIIEYTRAPKKGRSDDADED